MAKDINLLPKMMEEEVKRGEYRRYGSLLAYVLIGIVVVMLLGLFGFSLFLTQQAGQVQENIGLREQGIQANLEKELQIRALASKIKLIKPLVDVPYTFSDIIGNLQEVLQLVPTLETTEAIVEGTDITYSGRAQNSEAVKTFLNSLIDQNLGGKYFDKVALTSLSRSETLTEYRFSVHMEFVPEKEVTNATQP